MTNKTQEQERERTYNRIYSEVQRLSSEVSGTATPVGFDGYLARLNTTQVRYIQEFNQMTHTERQDASLLIDMVLNQIHGRLDVFRARAMRGELKPRK